MTGRDAVIFDGEAKVTKKTTFEVIFCEGGQPLAVAEFRNEGEARSYAEALNGLARQVGAFNREGK